MMIMTFVSGYYCQISSISALTVSSHNYHSSSSSAPPDQSNISTDTEGYIEEYFTIQLPLKIP